MEPVTCHLDSHPATWAGATFYFEKVRDRQSGTFRW